MRRYKQIAEMRRYKQIAEMCRYKQIAEMRRYKQITVKPRHNSLHSQDYILLTVAVENDRGNKDNFIENHTGGKSQSR